jgi:hypothetical protein
MKHSIFLLLLFLFSCEKSSQNSSFAKKEPPKDVPISKISSKENINDSLWFQYYRRENPNFRKENFKLEQTFPIPFQETTVTILNKKGFHEIYKAFLVFNESKTKYIDFDSYQWFPNSDGSISFEADQQIVLVDYVHKNARQIAFFGPSYWIEEAYWKSDSVAVLMGNSYEKVPFIFEYDFTKNMTKYFKYPDTLQFEMPYSKIRWRSKGIRVD